MLQRLWFTAGKRFTCVRPVHDFGVQTGWQVVKQNVVEGLVHDLSQFGPVVAAGNFVESVRWRWKEYPTPSLATEVDPQKR